MANPKVEFRVPPASYAALDYLKRFGHYGNGVGEIARTLMNRELDDLRRGGVIPPDLPIEPGPPASSPPTKKRRS